MSSIFLPRCVLDYINPFTKITNVQASSPYLLGVVPHSFLRVCLRATGLSKCPNKCLSKCPNKWNSQVSQLVCIFFSPFSEGSFILNCLLYTQLCVFATLSGLLPLSQEQISKIPLRRVSFFKMIRFLRFSWLEYKSTSDRYYTSDLAVRDLYPIIKFNDKIM